MTRQPLELRLLQYRFSLDRRLSLWLILSLGLVAALVAYVSSSRNRVSVLKLAAGSEGGESHLFSLALEQVVERYQPKIDIEVLITPGTKENLQLLEDQKAQLVAAQADAPVGSSARLVSLLFPDLYQLVATNRSAIRSISDLRGKRVGVLDGGGQAPSLTFLTQHYRLENSPGLIVPFETEARVANAFRANQVDAVFWVRTPGNRSILELVQNNQGRLIAIDQADAMRISKPALEPASIPKGAYQGAPPIPDTPLPTVAVQRTLLAHQAVDAEVIQQVTAILYEHRQEIDESMQALAKENPQRAAGLPLASYVRPPEAGSGVGVPLHAGAQAYYDREKPSFVQANADYVGLLLTVTLLIGSWTWQGKNLIDRRRREVEQKRKDKADDYIQIVINLMDSGAAKGVAEVRQELDAVLKRAVRALVEERISQESFQSFRVIWQIVLEAAERGDLQAQPASQPKPPAQDWRR